MICPRCNKKYDEGHTNCNRCGIRLVDEPAGAADDHPFNDSAELFVPMIETYNSMDIAFIKSIFDQEEIDYFFLGEHFMMVQPMAIPARLMVRRDQTQRALQILQDLELSYLAAGSSALAAGSQGWDEQPDIDENEQPEEDK